jgi:hypothetical protein
MPRYSEEQRVDPRTSYLDAAIDLAAEGGWGAVSVRNVGAAVAKSASPVHREGILSIKAQLVTAAFAELKVPLVSFMDATPPLPRGELHATILRHLRATPKAARLMVQVSAQAGLTGSAEADAVSAHFAAEHKRAVEEVTGFYHEIDRAAALPNCRTWAHSLMRWYVAVCGTLVTDPDVTDGSLLAMAR